MADLFVCLSFDHDNVAAGIARNMVSLGALSRGDFGITGARRILALLAEQRLPSTWFIPGHTAESYPTCVQAVHAAGHEIGNHGWTHRGPATLNRDSEAEELISGNIALEALTGRRPRGYRAPDWDLSPHSVDLLLQAGFLYDSSMMGQDTIPYQARTSDRANLLEPVEFGPDTALVEMPVHWSLDDAPYFEPPDAGAGSLPAPGNARAALETWLDEFRYMKTHQDWGVLTYTFHPHIIGRGHRMLMLERLMEELRREDAIFLTLEDAVGEYQRKFPDGVSLRGR